MSEKHLPPETAMVIQNRAYPVLDTITVRSQPIPLLNIRMMSDERERELARKEATP